MSSVATANALLEVSADLRRNTDALDRASFQLTRIANASEDTNALALNEVRDAKLAMEWAATALEDVKKQLAVLVDNVKDTQREVTDSFRKTEPEHFVPRTVDAVGRIKPETYRAIALVLASLVAVAVLCLWVYAMVKGGR